MTHEKAKAARAPAVLLLLLGAAVAGCGGLGGEGDARSGLSCIDDSPECIGRRQAALAELVADKQRKWVHEPATAEAYASGVRLFAWRGKKNELSCEELVRGRREADSAPAVLRAAGSRLTPAQVSRGTMLAAEVSRELATEYARRCRRT